MPNIVDRDGKTTAPGRLQNRQPPTAMDRPKAMNKEPCTRCGKCCLSGGPALHRQDMDLIGVPGGMDICHLVTVRKGEPVHDQPGGKTGPLAEEMLKIKGGGGSWACIFYDRKGKACKIYDFRPLECRVLDCRDTSELERIYSRERLGRKDLLEKNHPLWELVDLHEKECPAGELAGLHEKSEAGDAQAAKRLAGMVRYDQELRKAVLSKAGVSPGILDFLFGRPVSIILKGFGTDQKNNQKMEK